MGGTYLSIFRKRFNCAALFKRWAENYLLQKLIKACAQKNYRIKKTRPLHAKTLRASVTIRLAQLLPLECRCGDFVRYNLALHSVVPGSYERPAHWRGGADAHAAECRLYRSNLALRAQVAYREHKRTRRCRSTAPGCSKGGLCFTRNGNVDCAGAQASTPSSKACGKAAGQ